ncbi:MAG: hypothetical protein GY810_17525 [Aureispira sp.]|nr:hypothetical protein [Aureispira sp.]
MKTSFELLSDSQWEFIKETFELYEEALKRNVLLESGKISPFAFTNIVAVALGLKKYDWTWNFIHKYTLHLPSKTKQAYTDYNLSRWHFHQQEYQKAEELLVADDFEDLHLNLSAKMLLLKIYYELRELQLLDGLLNRFRTYLSRQKNWFTTKKIIIILFDLLNVWSISTPFQKRLN